MEEPAIRPQLPRPCSTPHSAPVEWLEEVTKPYLPREDEPAMTPEMVKPSPFTRHDGWTGEKMAIFCEALAETAVVAEACERANMGISGAYACRRRNPVFAAAWDAALTIARERLADTLLARSMEGNVEQIWKDGEVIGERHLLDNRLGLAILKRLDRLAERDAYPCAMTRTHRSPNGAGSGSWGPAPTKSPAIRSQSFDWTLAIDALRTGDETLVCKALALAQGNEVEEVEDHHFLSDGGDNNEAEEIDLSHRFWAEMEDGEKRWFTDFPPPADFTGYQNSEWGDPDRTYVRECSVQEIAILEADASLAREADRAEQEELRDTWLELLKEECSCHPGLEPGPAFTSGEAARTRNPRRDRAKSGSPDE